MPYYEERVQDTFFCQPTHRNCVLLAADTREIVRQEHHPSVYDEIEMIQEGSF